MSAHPQARSTAPRAAPLVPDRHPGGAALPWLSPIYIVSRAGIFAIGAMLAIMAMVFG